MRTYFALSVTLLLGALTPAQNAKKAPVPDQFELGVFTFFDFGPPFNYYNLYVVRPSESGTEVERFIFTPPSDKCFGPAKLESSSALLRQSVTELLGEKNPCQIPDRKLKKELKRCKNCSVFSGSKVVMQVKCGEQTRFIRSDILDRDMFGPASATPENTSWTMGLLAQLDKASGPGVMDKPAFQQETASPSTQAPLSAKEQDILAEVNDGEYDGLFPNSSGDEKLSTLYKQTQGAHVAAPSIELKSSSPINPEKFVKPNYPTLALITRTGGAVRVAFEVLPDGSTKDVRILSGHKLLNQSVLDAIANWKYPAEAAGKTIEATVEFAVNCPE